MHKETQARSELNQESYRLGCCWIGKLGFSGTKIEKCIKLHLIKIGRLKCGQNL